MSAPTHTPHSTPADPRGDLRRRRPAGALLALAVLAAVLGALLLVAYAFDDERQAEAREAGLTATREAVLGATALSYPVDDDLVGRSALGGRRIAFADAVEIGKPLEEVRRALLERRDRTVDAEERSLIDRAVSAIDAAGGAIRTARDAPRGADSAKDVLTAAAATQEPIRQWVTFSDRALRAERERHAERRGRLLAATGAALGSAVVLVLLLLLHLRRARRGTREALDRAAMIDSLTGLHNQGAFRDRIAREIARSRRSGAPLSLVMLDIDHFRRVNDAYGYRAGDALLAEIGRALASAAREEDLVGRMNGETFAWLAVDSDGAGAMIVAERARRAVAGTEVTGLCTVTASAGVAEHVPNETAGDLITRADAALQQAKAGGRDRIHRIGEGAPRLSKEGSMPTVGVIRAP